MGNDPYLRLQKCFASFYTQTRIYKECQGYASVLLKSSFFVSCSQSFQCLILISMLIHDVLHTPLLKSNSIVEESRNVCFVLFVTSIILMLLQVTSKEIHGPCDIIDEAIKRYPKRIFPPAAANVYSHLDPLHRKQRRRDARREMKTDPM